MIISFIVGWVMMGVFAFLPLFFQTVYGLSATNSGIQIFPLAIAMPVFSIISGILISKTGKYWVYAPLGTLILGIGFYLLSIIPETYNVGIVSGYLIVMGTGIGLVMQTLVLIAQGAVPAKDIAVATTTVTFIRSLGSVFGTSIFGTLINNFVAEKLGFVVSGAGAGGNLHALPQPVIDAFYYAYTKIFLYAVPVTALAFIFSPFIKNIALRTSIGGELTPRNVKKNEHKDIEMAKIEEVKKQGEVIKSMYDIDADNQSGFSIVEILPNEVNTDLEPTNMEMLPKQQELQTNSNVQYIPPAHVEIVNSALDSENSEKVVNLFEYKNPT